MGLRALTRLLVVLLIALGGAAVGYYLRSSGAGAGEIQETTDLPVVVRQIRDLSELVTVKYSVQKVVGLEEKKSPFGAERILLIVQAEVLGGVDLSEIREQDIARASGGGVRIAMPAARVLHVVLNEKETRVWDRDVTWWTPWVPANPDLERQARLKALESIKETAFAMGIHEDARRNAEDAIRRLLESAGVKPVLFVEASSSLPPRPEAEERGYSRLSRGPRQAHLRRKAKESGQSRLSRGPSQSPLRRGAEGTGQSRFVEGAS